MWSKIVHFGVGIIAKDYYDINGCQYHNWQHILDCYAYLEKTNVPYSVTLDWAVLFHDIVYDNQPEKEKRSADFFMQTITPFDDSLLNENEKQLVYNTVMATVTHECNKGPNKEIINAMIRADLHQLADAARAVANYSKIMNESVKLYGISETEFAKNNLLFMESLEETVIRNYNLEYDKFWLDVLSGIRLTQDISSSLIKHF